MKNKMGKLYHFCFLFFVFCLLMFVIGCAKKLPPPLAPLSTPAELSTEELYQLIQQRADNFQNFRGIARIRLINESKKYRFKEVVILEKPDLFRLETLGFLNQPALFIVSDGELLALYSKRDNTYYSGVASQANLFKLTGLNMLAEDVVRVLAGNAPILEEVSSMQSRYLPDLKAYQLELISVSSQLKQVIGIDATTKTLSQAESFQLPDKSLLIQILWGEYRDVDGLAIPSKIIIDKPLDKTRIELSYQSFEVNQNLDGDLFLLKPPEHAKIYLLDDPTEEPLERLAPFEEFERKNGSEQNPN